MTAVRSPKMISRAEEVLGSHIEITLPSEHETLLSACFLELQRIERTYSRFRPDSVISRINSQLGVWHEIPAELTTLLLRAEELRRESDGCFDITVKQRLDELGYDSAYSFTEKERAEDTKLPSRSLWRSLAAFLALRRKSIVIDKKRNRVLVRKQIEIGGFGKGYAIERLRHILDEAGVQRYYINAGGDVYGKCSEGIKISDQYAAPWRTALENPDDATKAIGTILLRNQALACSAPNRRTWKGRAGRMVHHLIDPKSGEPQRTIKCIFVLAGDGLSADGYATALFAAGYQRAIQLARRLPVQVLIISAENKIFRSNGFDAELFL